MAESEHFDKETQKRITQMIREDEFETLAKLEDEEDWLDDDYDSGHTDWSATDEDEEVDKKKETGVVEPPKEEQKTDGEVEKGAKHFEKLHKKLITDKRGHRRMVWVRGEEEPKKERTKKQEEKKKFGKKDLSITSTKGKSTQDLHKKGGVYTVGRESLHKKIVKDIFKGAGKPKEGEKPKVILMGGGTASGKSTMLKGAIMPSLIEKGYEFGLIDSDDIKNELPEYADFQKENVETAAFRVHNESSDIASKAMSEVMKEGRNFILDGTMKNPSKYIGLIQKLKKAGYEVELAIADVPLDVAKERAANRARETGRTVPDDVIEGSHKGVPKAFGQIKDMADSWRVFDMAEGGKLVADKNRVFDDSRYQQFLNK